MKWLDLVCPFVLTPVHFVCTNLEINKCNKLLFLFLSRNYFEKLEES